jgi:glycosyl transferase family 25
MIYYIITLLVIIILFIILKSFKQFEHFDNFENFDIYVITLKNEDRINNINKQQEKIDLPIQIFDAVNGKNLNLNDYKIGSGFKSNENYRKREVGCYLSHYNIYKKCKKSGYTIVFEDDFSIDVEKLIEKINNSIKKLKNANIDFDIMFIGNHAWNDKHGNLILDDLYKIGNSEGLGGTHAYVINNKNIDKLINETSNIDEPIDVKIQKMADEGKLNVIKTYPYYVNTIDSPSTIATGENFTNYNN